MANLGYVSTFNVNGNELSLKDAALTEIVNEIIEAIGANNTNIAERINDLHNRSFDNTIKISSQNESEIASIQDGLYKIQYVTVTGEGDNATETLNNSAILIQKDTTQYLYKDGTISSRTKENNTWGQWANMDSEHPIKEFTSNTNTNQIAGTLYNEPDGYYLISWRWDDEGTTQTWGPELLKKNDDLIFTLADSNNNYDNNSLYYYDYDNNVYNVINFDNLIIKNAKTYNEYENSSLLSPLPASNRTIYNMLQELGLIQVSETYDEETEKTIYSITLPTDNIEHPIILAVKDYERFAEDDEYQENPNYGLYESLMNLDFVKPFGDEWFLVPDWIGTVGATKIAYVFGLIPHDPYEASIYPDRKICDIGLIEVKTVSKSSNFMYQYDYNIEATEYLLLTRKKRTINYRWLTTGEINALDFRNVAWTDYDYFLKNISYPVTSVNGQTGAVTVNVPVTSVNGQTGAVSLSIPDAQIQADWNQTTTTAKDYIKNKPTIPAAQIQADWNQTTTTASDYIKNKPTIKDELSSDYEPSDLENEYLELSAGDTYEQAFGKLEKLILDNSQVTAAALNELADEINTMGELSPGYTPSENINNGLYLEPGDSYEIAFGKLEKLVNDNEIITAAGLNDLNDRLNDLDLSNVVTSVNGMTGAVITQLSNDYVPSSEVNENLELAAGDTYEEAFGKLHKAILDNEQVVAGTLADFDERIDDLADVASSGDYYDLLNLPTIPTVPTTSTTVTENDTNPVSGGAVYAKVADLIGSAPAALDTLGEIAAALNNDADLAGTLTNQIAGKISKVSPATAGNFASLNSDGTLSDSGHKHSDYLTSETQADWNETNTSSAAYINNKPTIKDELSSNYATSTDTNDDLLLASGDTYEEAFGKIEKAILDNELVTSTAVNDLNTRINNLGTLATVATSGDYNDLTNRPVSIVNSVNGQTGAVTLTIPDAVTESTVAGWGFTKNTGTLTTETQLSKGTATGTGNAVTDINVSNHQITLVKGKTFLETAPVTSVNGKQGAVTVKENVQSDWNATTGDAVILNKPTIPAAVTESTVAGWGFTKNTGTLTTETQLSKGTATGTGNAVTDINVSNHQITLVKGKTFLETAPVTSVNGQTGAVIVKANVQSDWNATTGDAVILNKPTIPTVNDSTVTLTMNGNTVGTFTLNKSGNTTIDLGTVLTSHQSIKTVNNESLTGTGNISINGLPTVTAADNGKVLMVVNGAWQLVSPVSLYSGSSTPSNSQGNNGDIYVQI